MKMTLSCCVIFTLLLRSTLCTADVSLNETLLNGAIIVKTKINNTNDNSQQEITNTNGQQEQQSSNITKGSVVIPKFRDDITKIVSQIQPDQIKEDDKNGSQTTKDSELEVTTTIAENLVHVNNSKAIENITTSSTKPFSPSPYLGSVVEEVIEEPIAQNRDFGVGTDFIPMRSRQSFNSFVEDIQLPRQNPTFHTSSGVVPVQGGSYFLHSDNSISEDFENTNFNENPFGRIKFPDEKSKYYPLFLNENEIDGRDKPIKFDFDSNYKNYDFPYKIENTGLNPDDVQKEPQYISDKTHHGFSKNKNNNENGASTVHGPDLMKNINMTLPLEAKKKFPAFPYSTWKKVAHTFMTFLPIGLMMAALPPRVIKMNSTNPYPAREDVPPASSSVNRYFKENTNSRQAT